ncbi:MAG: hypothetical protein V4736_01645 [Bdellovibrionota bacterium]
MKTNLRVILSATFLVTLLGAQQVLAVANPLADVKKIECENKSGRIDHHTITPNVYQNKGKNYAAVSGYYVNSSGQFDRKNMFYETIISKLDNGTIRIQLLNDNTQFQNDKEMNLFTTNFRTGALHWEVFQPGIGGYGPGGIPQSTFAHLEYQCIFVR